MEVWFEYNGSDAATAALFTFDPSAPGTPTAAGDGYLVRYYGLKVTNASTKVYTELTSWSAAEPVPTGYAEYLYTALEQLHFEGTLTIFETECSDLLPPGCVFNTSDGLAAWQAMDALVLSVSEDIDNGLTRVQFGPPLMLGLGELEELFRANLGRLPSFKLTQRTSGKTTAGSNVIGDKHAADSTATGPPSGGTGGIVNPYTCTNASVGATPMIAVTPGTHGGTLATGSPLTVGAGTGIVYVQVDFSFDASGNLTISDNMLETSGSTEAPANTITGGSTAGGNGTLYQAIATYTATVMDGKARVSCAPLVGGSQNFGVCLAGPTTAGISGPWGV
jgi:hypothetical protein